MNKLIIFTIIFNKYNIVTDNLFYGMAAMKGLKLVSICVFFSVLLTGCGKNSGKSVALNESSLNTNFTYEYLNSIYNGEISFQGENCSFVISEPAELRGYSITVSNKGISVRYEDILIEYPDNAFCVRFPFKQVFDSISELKSAGFKEDKKGLYKCSSDDFTAFADENGNLCELDFPNGKLKLK